MEKLTGNILIVDDEVHVLEAIQDVVQSNGNCLTSSSVKQAKEIIENHDIDLVITDFNMPGETGLDLARFARSHDEELPVILVTGFATKELAVNALKEGIYDFVEKPFVERELLKVVNQALALRNSKKQIKALKQKNSQSEKLASLGLMASSIAHEILNPMNIILAQASLLKNKNDAGTLNSEGLQQGVERIERMGHRISKIIKGLKNLSRVGAQEETELIEVDGLVEDVLIIADAKLKYSDITVEIIKSQPKIELSCYRVELSQVLMNLLNNAIDALAGVKNPKITIALSLVEHEIQFAVSNNGKPIAQTEVEDIFSEFYTTKRSGEGTGLGLALSRQYCVKHRGSLELDHTHDETCFVVTIPQFQDDDLVSMAG